MIFHPILLQRKKQDPLKWVASVAPLNVASRAGLVGGGAQRRTSLQDLLEGQNCPGAEATPSASQRTEVKAPVHSLAQEATTEHLIRASLR